MKPIRATILQEASDDLQGQNLIKSEMLRSFLWINEIFFITTGLQIEGQFHEKLLFNYKFVSDVI